MDEILSRGQRGQSVVKQAIESNQTP
jgi:hypothetical protein